MTSIHADFDIVGRQIQAHSDARMKHFESDISNCLMSINQLKPKIYYKSQKLYDDDFILNSDLSNLKEGDILNEECGFFAQDIIATNNPDLQQTVVGGDYEDDKGNKIKNKYVVNYNSLFTINVKATQDLHKLILEQEVELNLTKSNLNQTRNKLDIMRGELTDTKNELAGLKTLLKNAGIIE